MNHLKKITYSMLLASTMIFSVTGLTSGRSYQEPDTMRSKSIADLQQMIDRNPGDAQALYYLGTNYEFSGHWPEAIDAYQRAAQAKPDFAHAYYRLGWTNLMADTPKYRLRGQWHSDEGEGNQRSTLRFDGAGNSGGGKDTLSTCSQRWEPGLGQRQY